MLQMASKSLQIGSTKWPRYAELSRMKYIYSSYRFASSAALAQAIRDPSVIEFKVGLIDKIEMHPNADNLYVSNVLIDASKSVQVCSGLVGKVPKEALEKNLFVFVTNLKPSKFRGVSSEAMILAGEESNSPTQLVVEPVRPPKGCQPGDILQFESYGIPNSNKLIKSKIWDQISRQLSINSQGNVIYTDLNQRVYRLISQKGDSSGAAYVSRLTGGKVR